MAPADGIQRNLATPVLRAEPWRAFATPEAIAAWDALAAAVAEPNPFYESWYLLPSLEALDPQSDVQIVVLQSGEQMLGLMPLRRESSYYGHRVPHWRNRVHPNCFLGQPLVRPGFESAFWQAMLKWIDQSSRQQLFLHLALCPLDGALHAALKHELAARNRPAATVLSEERALLSSELTPDAYLETSLSTKKRKELRRQHRRLEDLGEVRFERCHDAADLTAWMRTFLTLEHSGWKGQAGSSLATDPRNAALFTQALEGAAQRGKLERLTLLSDGTPIAMLANFITPPGAFSYKTAFAEDYARFSPGVLLQRENLALLSQPEIAWVDSCASADHPMIDHFWRERRTIAGHSIAIGGAVRRAAFQLLSRTETGAAPTGIA